MPPPKTQVYEWGCAKDCNTTHFAAQSPFRARVINVDFTALFALRQFTDHFAAKPGFPVPIACKCANHPSSGKSSRVLRIAFTAAGFAFPPVAFIT